MSYDMSQQILVLSLQQAAIESSLGDGMVVYDRLGYTRFGGNLIQGDAVVAALREQPQSGLHDQLAALAPHETLPVKHVAPSLTTY